MRVNDAYLLMYNDVQWASSLGALISGPCLRSPVLVLAWARVGVWVRVCLCVRGCRSKIHVANQP